MAVAFNRSIAAQRRFPAVPPALYLKQIGHTVFR